MATETNANDPMAVPAGSLDAPEFPILREGIKRLIIRDTEKKVSEKKTDTDVKITEYLSMRLTTTEDDKDTEGNVIYAGYSFLTTIFLNANERSSEKMVAEQIAMPIKAALGRTTKVSPRDWINDPSLLNDKVVDCKVGIRKGKDGFSDNNVVKSWIIPA